MSFQAIRFVLVATIIATSFLFSCPSELHAQWSQSYPNYYRGGYQHHTKPLWDDTLLQRELELTKSQRRKLIDLKIEFDEQQADIQLKINELQPKSYSMGENGQYKYNKEVQAEIAKMYKQTQELKTDFASKANKLLLPHQRKSYSEISLKRLIKQQGFLRNLHNVYRVLDVKAEDQKKLNAKKKELEAELAQVYIDFLKKAKSELLAEFPEKERKRLEGVLEQMDYGKPARNTASLIAYETYYLKNVSKEKK